MLKSEQYFMVRVPLLPYLRGKHASESDLKNIFSQPILQEAIFLASPILYEKLPHFLRGALPDHERKRMCLSLNKYLLRLSSRCTPFGLFAGVIKGHWKDHTMAKLQKGLSKRSSRLDTEYISELVAYLLKLPDVSSRVKYFPNDTIYVVDNNMRYVEYSRDKEKRNHQLSGMQCNPYLMEVIMHAQNGKNKFELAEHIVNAEIGFDDALSFVEEIIQNQLLVSELDMRLTGDDYFNTICEILTGHHIDLSLLHDIAMHLKKLDEQTPQENLTQYPILIEKLSQLATVEDPSHYIQVDVKSSSEIVIHQQVAETIENTASLLAGIIPAHENKNIENFRRAFFDRYEYQAVDLCAALDPELGLGYPLSQSTSLTDSLLLSDIEFHEEEKSIATEFSDFQKFLLHKYSEVLQNQKPVVLTREELKPFYIKPVLPNSLYAFASIYASSEQAVDAGDFRILFNGAFGPSAVTLMARFCHLDGDLAGMLRSTLEKDEMPDDVIFAEVIHANHPRTGNISTRPVLSDYEIPLLARSGVDKAHTIQISDLTLSVIGNRIVLKSKRLNKEIIPRLSSAHNFSHNTISIYRFLCDLQHQGLNTSVKWDWGILKTFSYLPTVTLENVILSPARWRLSDHEVSSIKNACNLKQVVTLIRQKRNIPDKVIVGQTDNKIVVDLENESHLPVFQKLIENTNVVEECFLSDDNIFIKDIANEGYVHELVVPLTNTVKEVNRRLSEEYATINTHNIAHREFTLGSEWLYYKIYCNSKAVDQVLLEVVKPLTEALLGEGIIDKWFFIRYNDSRNHIRLRLHGQMSFYQKAIEKLHELVQPHVKTGLIASIVTDTYKREIERYGHENMVASESIFYVDSATTLGLLDHLDGRENLRWQMALLGGNELFSVFNLPLEKRREIALDLQQQFFKEMKMNSALKKSLASSVRSNKKTIEDLMLRRGLDSTINQILLYRSERLQPIAMAILEQARSNKLSVSVESLLKSYLHMWFNRLFQSHPRHHEMVLYDYLFQFYNSQLAKNKIRMR